MDLSGVGSTILLPGTWYDTTSRAMLYDAVVVRATGMIPGSVE